jgi:DNA-binding transcriptional LysR family regulator
MELRQLQYFVAIADEGHFTRAAERVLIAQPAISQQIRRLEAELGEPLFDRDRRHVRLTAAGRALLPHARATLAGADRAKAAVRSLSGLLSGQLTVGAFEGAPEGLLATALGRFRRAHPAVEVQAKEGYAAELLTAVQRGELDVAITGLPDTAQPPTGVNVTELAIEPLVLAVSPDHPLARRPQVPLTRLRDEPMIALASDSSQRAHVERACRQAGFEPRITVETMRLSLLWELVSQGVGIAIIPRLSPGGDARVTLIPITRPRLHVRIVLASSQTTPSPAAQAFLGIITGHSIPTDSMRSTAAPASSEAARSTTAPMPQS